MEKLRRNRKSHEEAVISHRTIKKAALIAAFFIHRAGGIAVKGIG